MQARYYTAKAVRELDRLAIKEHHIPGFTLMQRAGKIALGALRSKWPDARQLIVFCGTGNNGGDGCVLAGLAMEKGLRAEIWFIRPRSNTKGDARLALEFAEDRKVPIHDSGQLPDLVTDQAGTVIVDALLGTGLTGEVSESYRKAILNINRSGLPVLAVDIPSGLCSDTGAVLGACVKADLTVTFIGRKLGLITGEGPRVCGSVAFDDLGVPSAIYAKVEAARIV